MSLSTAVSQGKLKQNNNLLSALNFSSVKMLKRKYELANLFIHTKLLSIG